jgi:hypothetical protein
MIKKKHSLDDAIAIILIAVGLLAFYEARTSFSPDVAIFPMIASGIVVASATIWSIRSFLPNVLYTALIEYEDDTGIDELDDELIDREDEQATDPEPMIDDSLLMYKLISITIAFVVIAYLIGFLWATPVFIIMYGKLMDFKLRNYIIIGAISFVIVFSFAYFTTVAVDEGLLWGTNL